MTTRTLKFKYTLGGPKASQVLFWEEFNKIQREQANLIRIAFNRAQEGLNEGKIRALLRAGTYNNVPLDTWFQQSAIRAGVGAFDSAKSRNQETVVFGKKSLDEFNQGKISKLELLEARKFGVISTGEAPQRGNRKFQIISSKEITFKPRKGLKFSLTPEVKRNYQKVLNELSVVMRDRVAPVTFKLTKTHLHVTFDVQHLSGAQYKPQAGRVLGVDMNPNRQGFAILDKTQRVIKAESFDMMELRIKKNTNRIKNKKKHEIIEIAHYLVRQAISTHCEAIAVESLQIGAKNHKKGKTFNRTVNNDSNSGLFHSVLEKLCALHKIKFIEAMPQYTSFMGTALFELPDPLSAGACVAYAGQMHLKAGKFKFFAWFKQPTQAELENVYNSSTYLNQWKKEDLSFTSVRELYESVKEKFPAGGMSQSYHAPVDPKDPQIQSTCFGSRKSRVIKHHYDVYNLYRNL